MSFTGSNNPNSSVSVALAVTDYEDLNAFLSMVLFSITQTFIMARVAAVKIATGQ
jgi:hypothetical protein